MVASPVAVQLCGSRAWDREMGAAAFSAGVHALPPAQREPAADASGGRLSTSSKVHPLWAPLLPWGFMLRFSAIKRCFDRLQAPCCLASPPQHWRGILPLRLMIYCRLTNQAAAERKRAKQESSEGKEMGCINIDLRWRHSGRGPSTAVIIVQKN